MWAYRITQPYDMGPTISPEVVAQSLGFVDGISFNHARRISLELCKHIDWDGTLPDEVYCWAVPGLRKMSIGFIFQDIQGRTFIVSPIALPHLAKGLDWDAMVSHEEIAQTRRVIRTGDLEKPKAALTQDWQISRKGNLFAKINAAAVTVFRVDNGYKAILNPIGRNPITTQVFPNQDECCDYVLDNWYEILEQSIGDDTQPVDDDGW